MTVTALPPVDRPEQALVRAVDMLAGEVPAELPGGLALERARIVLEQAERLRVLGLQALTDIDSRELFTLAGVASTAAWVRALPVAGVGRADVALARRLGALSEVQAELLAGRLRTADAVLIGRAVATARPFLDRPDGLIDGQPAEPALYGTLVDGICLLLAEQTGGAPADDPDQDRLRADLEAILDTPGTERARLEAALVLFAQRGQPGLLRPGLELLLDALLPAEHDKRAERAEQSAGLELRRKRDGSGWTLRGDLDDETGELLATVLAAEQAVDPAAPADTDAWRAAAAQPDLTGLPPEFWPAAQARPRSRRQLQHAALSSGLRRLLDSGALGTRDKALPHLLITVGLDYLNALPGAMPGRAASGARWSRHQLRRIACRSQFTRIVLDAGGRFLQASHTQRTSKAIERHISQITWGGRCAGTGCGRGPATGHRLVPHHVNPFSQTGTTSLDDCVPVCEYDHHELHDNRRVLHLRDGRWIGPDGPCDGP